MIIEDDVHFAGLLLDLAREHGFKGLVSLRGEVGLALAKKFQPSAITLDLNLPDMDGWTILDRLKHDPNTRHIPVEVISVEDRRWRGLRFGAIGYLQKPVTKDKLEEALNTIKKYIDRPARSLLIVEDNEDQRNSIIELIGNEDVNIVAVGSGEETIQKLQEQVFDCMVLDLGLPDMAGLDLIRAIHKDLGLSELPIIVYTGKELSRQEEIELRKFTEAVIIKDVRSPERLLDETALFLHRLQTSLPEAKQRMLRDLHQTDPILDGAKVLVVDDDVRNIFALMSLLEPHNVDVLYAENGKDAIEVVKNNPDIDLVLMDVMMPEMDGYETTRAIRALDDYKNLPIIALTAKAMKGDREKCLEAGASDYLAKPVDTDQLLSVLRVWLYK